MALIIDTSHADQVKIRFVWVAAEPVGTMSVVGSFNDWTPGLDELLEDRDGHRSVTVGLPYDHEISFRYLASNGRWFDEHDADAITAEGSILRAIPKP